MQQSSELADILRAVSFLIDSAQSASHSDLKAVLVSRLTQYYATLGHHDKQIASTEEELQLETAQEALSVVERVQKILSRDGSPTPPTSEGKSQGLERNHHTLSEAPAIGTRDLAQLRTLISITFKWGVELLLVRVVTAWPCTPSSTQCSRSKVIDLTTIPEDYKQLSSLLVHLLTILFPDGVDGSLPQTLITATLLNRHLADLLNPCIALGWLPKSLSSEATPAVDEIRPKIMHLLGMYVPTNPSVLVCAISNALKFATIPNNICVRCSPVWHTPTYRSCAQVMFFALESSVTPPRGPLWSLCRCIR
jgi:hypothetical protein